MKERLEQLKKQLIEMRSESYSDQYSIADFVSIDNSQKEAINLLAEESQLYTSLINQTIDLLCKLKANG